MTEDKEEMNLLRVSGISKRTTTGFSLEDTSFKVQPLQKVALAGETGSGKSTLLKIIAGLVQPDTGEVLFEDERVAGPEEKLIPGHRAIGYLSQHFELRNNYRVWELLEMANKVSLTEAAAVYDVCRITQLLHRKTDQLSGGEKQRIATARLLVSAPRLLLLDEPYSNLDMVHKNILKSVIADIGQQLQITCMMVSHDPLDTLSWADEIIVMKGGQVIQKGSPGQVYRQPFNEYVAGLFGSYTLLPANHGAIISRLGDQNGKMAVITRPSDWQIVSNEQALTGEVKKIRFYGGYSELEVLVEDTLITVNDLTSSLVPGDLVYLVLKTADRWYI